MPIPASTLVSVTPSVLNPGGTGLNLAGMFLTQNTNVPIGAPTSFANLTAVGNYFGASSTEYAAAQVYFNGFDSSNIKPGLLWFAQYPNSAVAAYLRGATVTSLTAVQAILPAVTAGTSTIAPGTGAQAGYGVMTVATVSSGVLTAGMLLTGTNVTAGTRIVSQLTGTTGAAGTYLVSISQTVAATAITGAFDLSVTIDSVAKTASSLNLSTATSLSNAASLLATALGLSGGQTCTYSSQFNAFVITSGTTGVTSTITFPASTGGAAPILGLNQSQGAVLSQGAAAVGTNQSSYMAGILSYTTNWASLMTMWEPTTAVKQAFATWVSSTSGRYLYVAYDSDATAVQSPSAFTGFGYWLRTNSISGVVPVYNDIYTAAMVCGMGASTDFTQLNGRVSYMFKTNSQVPTAIVTDATSYSNLIANGYNAYCQFGVQSSPNMLANGQISGPFLWVDSYVGALYLAVSLQQAMVTLLQQQKSIPYNTQGYALIMAAAQDPINQAINFGTIRPNTPPSTSEIAQMNAAAGQKIDDVVGSRGWYLQVAPASATTRTARQSPPINLWYMDGQSVQQINIASVDVL